MPCLRQGAASQTLYCCPRRSRDGRAQVLEQVLQQGGRTDAARTEPDPPAACGVGDVAAPQRGDPSERLGEKKDRGTGEANPGIDAAVRQQSGHDFESFLVGGDRWVARRGRPGDLQPPRCRVRATEPVDETADGAPGAGTSRQPFIEHVLSQTSQVEGLRVQPLGKSDRLPDLCASVFAR